MAVVSVAPDSPAEAVTDRELELVEDALEGVLASDVPLLSQASRYIVCSGGKRIRPRLVLLAYHAAGGEDTSPTVPLAAAVELLHTASLVHDDINDRSSTRRGQASINARFGDGLALLVGDFIFIRFLSLLSAFAPRVVERLAEACAAIIEGETLQMLHLGDADLSEETYLSIVSQKTASLFAACTAMGAVLAGASPEEIAALEDYGTNLGIAFQIRDDTLDLVGNTDELGKPVASDLRQGKMSLATILAMRASEGVKAVLISGDRARADQLLRETRAIEYAMAKAGAFSERAKEALSVLPASWARTELSSLAHLAVVRDK